MKIVVAIEDKIYAQAITDCICSMTWDEKPEFKILSAVPPLKFPIPAVAGAADTRYVEVQEERRRAAKSLVLGVGTQIAQHVPHATIEDAVIDGDPKVKITELAKDYEADLIVMGSHSRGNLERLFVGSTSLTVLSHSPCSVLIVKLAQTADKEATVTTASSDN